MSVQSGKAKVRKEYIAWCSTPRRLKVQLGLPNTKRDFADLKGVSERTLQRWDNLPDHDELVDQHKKRFAGNLDNAAISKKIGQPRPESHGNALKKYEDEPMVQASDDPVWNPNIGADEQRYLQVKDTLVRMAQDGHQAAIDLYLKHWGKPFIEAEQSTSGMFPNLSEKELRERICKLLGKEVLSEFLAREVAFQ
jgi:hypothetical protein